MSPPRVLTIAGSDSSGGAGIQADIKTITMLGGYAMTAITALTAQNTRAVNRVDPVPAEMVAAQIDACAGDIGVDAIKIGMLGSAAVADAVASRIEMLAVPIVFDPVMVATSGAMLADPATVAAFERLMGAATVTTPNIPELAALGGDAAMARRGVTYLAKGGDAEGAEVIDRLVVPGRPVREWRAPRIAGGPYHGTGCTLSSAIATLLGAGLALEPAIEQARGFVRLALRDAPGLGGGAQPLGHAGVRLDLGRDMRLNQLTLPANDYAASVAFYRALGLTQVVDSPGNGYARFECAGGATLSIAFDHGTAGGASPYFECADLEAVVARMAGQGIAADPPRDEPWLWRESWLSDPAGNRICLYQAGENRRYPPWRIVPDPQSIP